MLPIQYPAEWRTFADPLTGRDILQLTTDAASHNIHFYFTENSFIKEEEALYFLSDRDTAPTMNVFRLDLHSGTITRLTHHLPPEQTGNFTKDPAGTRVLYHRDRDILMLDAHTGETRLLYTLPMGWRPGRVSLNADGTLAGLLTNEDVRVEHGVNYAGFKEKMYLCKKSHFFLIPLDGRTPTLIGRDTHECGHFQFSPTDPDVAMYCHEGPWHLVHQRIWLLNVRTGEVDPCFRQGEDDSVGHEFWTQDGHIFFDNRGPGHDGTITSDRTQAVAQEAAAARNSFIPYVGLADAQGKVLNTYLLPHYCNHYHADSSNRLLVGDEVDNLVLIRLGDHAPVITPLCHHGTSWRGQHTHCHPTFDWDDAHVLYASDATGTVQLYLVKI